MPLTRNQAHVLEKLLDHPLLCDLHLPHENIPAVEPGDAESALLPVGKSVGYPTQFAAPGTLKQVFEVADDGLDDGGARGWQGLAVYRENLGFNHRFSVTLA